MPLEEKIKSLFKMNGDVIPRTDRNTTRYIARMLLYAFVIALIILFFVNIKIEYYSNAINKEWFELLKTSLATLGAILMTIIGYYFGQKGVEKVEEKLSERDEQLKIVMEDRVKSVDEISEAMKNIKKDDEEIPDAIPLRKKKK